MDKISPSQVLANGNGNGNGKPCPGDDPCKDRKYGQKPRNRQHQSAPYMWRQERYCQCLLSTITPSLVWPSNPYRTQISFNARLGGASKGVILAHSQADLGFGGAVYAPVLTLTVPFDINLNVTFLYNTPTVLLSFPIHGPLVTAEWWVVGTANPGAPSEPFDYLHSTAWSYSD